MAAYERQKKRKRVSGARMQQFSGASYRRESMTDSPWRNRRGSYGEGQTKVMPVCLDVGHEMGHGHLDTDAYKLLQSLRKVSEAREKYRNHIRGHAKSGIMDQKGEPLPSVTGEPICPMR